MRSSKIPVVDLFAGPGGLGEGFASVRDLDGKRVFDIRTSIEKDTVAHQTLSLRALYRALTDDGKIPDIYYDYIRGNASQEQLYQHPTIRPFATEAKREAQCKTLGEDSENVIDRLIRDAIGSENDWVLIGGPPCQAYSLAGRSRRINVDPTFEDDPKHLLYREYLRIIRKFRPAVFVMENVKGMLSSTHKGSRIFDRIFADLSRPAPGVTYEIRSFVRPAQELAHDPEDYIIRSEKFGVPQMRHRVILFGVRSDHTGKQHEWLREHRKSVSVSQALEGLPSIRSRLSKEPDSFEKWLGALGETRNLLRDWDAPYRTQIEERIDQAVTRARHNSWTGSRYTRVKPGMDSEVPRELARWLQGAASGEVYQHEARSHMRSDLQRYLFAACFAEECGASPKLGMFPKELLPNHRNAANDSVPFEDRFRVQMSSWASTTIVSHIAKDGHYYIHFDPAQCRSLTVREAARLQTFPDDYFFEGNRTQQYHQVGNAVPPFLAKQLGEVVARFLGRQLQGQRATTTRERTTATA